MVIASRRQEIIDNVVNTVSRIRDETRRANAIDFVMQGFEKLGIKMDRQEFMDKVGLQ